MLHRRTSPFTIFVAPAVPSLPSTLNNETFCAIQVESDTNCVTSCPALCCTVPECATTSAAPTTTTTTVTAAPTSVVDTLSSSALNAISTSSSAHSTTPAVAPQVGGPDSETTANAPSESEESASEAPESNGSNDIVEKSGDTPSGVTEGGMTLGTPAYVWFVVGIVLVLLLAGIIGAAVWGFCMRDKGDDQSKSGFSDKELEEISLPDSDAPKIGLTFETDSTLGPRYEMVPPLTNDSSSSSSSGTKKRKKKAAPSTAVLGLEYDTAPPEIRADSDSVAYGPLPGSPPNSNYVNMRERLDEAQSNSSGGSSGYRPLPVNSAE